MCLTQVDLSRLLVVVENDNSNMYRVLYYFPLAAVTNDHTFSSLKHMNFIAFSSGGQKATTGLAGLESRGEQSCAASEGSRGEPVPCHVRFRCCLPSSVPVSLHLCSPGHISSGSHSSASLLHL